MKTGPVRGRGLWAGTGHFDGPDAVGAKQDGRARGRYRKGARPHPPATCRSGPWERAATSTLGLQPPAETRGFLL